MIGDVKVYRDTRRPDRIRRVTLDDVEIKHVRDVGMLVGFGKAPSVTLTLVATLTTIDDQEHEAWCALQGDHDGRCRGEAEPFA